MTARSLFDGKCVTCQVDSNNIAEICFDNKESSVNKFNLATLTELQNAVDKVKAENSIKGLLLTSGKDTFIVGADITEFLGRFKAPDDQLESWLLETHSLFNSIEDLPYPTVCAINGICLGGGFELALSATYRVASTQARVGLPETKLGIYPGWGGTIRLPRLIGADNAIEWIAAGENHRPDAALSVGALDAVVNPEGLKDAALSLIQDANSGKLDWQAKRAEKMEPLTLLSDIEATMVFEGAKAFVAGKVGTNYPAPIEAISVMQKGAKFHREQAIPLEVKGFVKMAKTQVAENLVTLFLSDQYNKKVSKTHAKASSPTSKAAVLGAGIMGGGIAYQSASKGTPIIMKDINDKAIDLGLSEAAKLLGKQVARKKIDNAKMAKIMGAIRPTLTYGDFEGVDVVVEAVVENEKIKKSVLAEVEEATGGKSVLTSNTSTISISKLAEGLKNPANFCGMHFFNPVHRMPLVEVIRGEKTSDAAISAVVGYAMKMGKTPIVVNDCPGFLVNRILFPYFAGLSNLIQDGVDFVAIDKAMEKFGWPMGPAYLLDVIGIDTCMHAQHVMAQGYPDRMQFDDKNNVVAVMANANRFGQKNGTGFYSYTMDKKGRPKKSKDASTYDLLKPLVKNQKSVDPEEIVDRMMIPMINEAARCLEEKIVATPMELDLGLLYGLGFPPFRGGALKYADSIGTKNLVEKTKKYESLGPCYQAAPMLAKLAESDQKFYRG